MTQPFHDTYLGYSPWVAGGVQRDIDGHEPDPPGDATRFPVLLYLHGTWGEVSIAREGAAITEAAAQRDFVAAAVKYDSSFTWSVDGARTHAQYIFAGVDSALSRVASRPLADRSRGVAVVGFSQGAGIAGFGPGLTQDAWVLWLLGFNGPVSPETKQASEDIAPDRVRVTDGLQDILADGTPDYSALNTLTQSADTPVQSNRLRGDGSGYYIVEPAEVSDGKADHCFFINTWLPCVGATLDTRWLNEARSWSLGPCLDWLRGLCG